MEEKNTWKEAGKDVEQSISELGRAILRSIKIGAEKILDEENKAAPGFRESWENVGRSIETAGSSVSKAVAKAARQLRDVRHDRLQVGADAALVEGLADVRDGAVDVVHHVFG